jgi:hypothetical protein
MQREIGRQDLPPEDVRAALLELPSHPELVDGERIDDFFQRQGFRTVPELVLLPEDMPQLRDVLADVAPSVYRQTRNVSEHGIQAVYLSDVDVALAVAWPHTLQDGGLELAKNVVHEKAHGIREYGESMRGTVEDEAFCEWQGTRFIRDELGFSNGVWGGQATVEMRIGGERIDLPAVFAWKNMQGEALVTDAAYIVYALEQLNMHVPGIWDSMTRARFSRDATYEFMTQLEELDYGLNAFLGDNSQRTDSYI